MTEPPTSSELDRRMERIEKEQRAGFDALNKRLDAFPTEQTILALFAVRDSQITTIQERLTEVAKELDDERRDRERADKEIETRADGAKRWAVTTMVGGVATLAAVLGVLLNLLTAVR